jgi:hypothetical protein
MATNTPSACISVTHGLAVLDLNGFHRLVADNSFTSPFHSTGILTFPLSRSFAPQRRVPPVNDGCLRRGCEDRAVGHAILPPPTTMLSPSLKITVTGGAELDSPVPLARSAKRLAADAAR